MSNARLHRCLEPGLSILVGTVDAKGTTSCCSANANASDHGLQSVTVYLPVATSHETIQNLATTGRLAVAATHPIDHCATQLKGTRMDARLAREDEAPFVRERLDAFADVLDTIGVPKRLTRSVSHWPAFAVTIRVEQVFDQTPGPNAGSRLR
ncbi:MAG: hypothetical protein ABW292_03140 [Vicinamibacterales bacterium]